MKFVNLFSLILFLILVSMSMNACRPNQESAIEKPRYHDKTDHIPNGIIGHETERDKVFEKNANVPAYVIEILTYIRTNNKAPDNYIGGRIFYNREKKLPGRDEQNRMINYREWDVKEKITGESRGPERLVTSENKAYYTKDHYTTFILIKEIY